jgi:hypothetical protein
MAWSFAAVRDVSPSESSALLMVATPTDEARARSSARQRMSERAARIWALRSERLVMLDEAVNHMIFY